MWGDAIDSRVLGYLVFALSVVGGIWLLLDPLRELRSLVRIRRVRRELARVDSATTRMPDAGALRPPVRIPLRRDDASALQLQSLRKPDAWLARSERAHAQRQSPPVTDPPAQR